jgi:hypothetical protein
MKLLPFLAVIVGVLTLGTAQLQSLLQSRPGMLKGSGQEHCWDLPALKQVATSKQLTVLLYEEQKVYGIALWVLLLNSMFSLLCAFW